MFLLYLRQRTNRSIFDQRKNFWNRKAAHTASRLEEATGRVRKGSTTCCHPWSAQMPDFLLTRLSAYSAQAHGRIGLYIGKSNTGARTVNKNRYTIVIRKDKYHYRTGRLYRPDSMSQVVELGLKRTLVRHLGSDVLASIGNCLLRGISPNGHSCLRVNPQPAQFEGRSWHLLRLRAS